MTAEAYDPYNDRPDADEWADILNRYIDEADTVLPAGTKELLAGRLLGRPAGPAYTGTHFHDVEGDVYRERNRRLARRLVDDEERAAQDPGKPYDVATLGEILERPDDPPGRVSELIPWEASTLVVAQHKTGKTTFVLNLARSLITGDPFLDEFPVVPVDGAIALLNFEVSGKTVAHWANKVGVPHDRLIIVNLRGTSNPFANPERLAELGKALRDKGVETVVVDPFGRAYTGDNQNDNGPVGQWLAGLDEWARTTVGARDVVLVAHAGWDGERVRGATALADWPDSIITLTRDNNDVRYMKADGRDVHVPEDALTFDPNTNHLTLSGTGSRKANRDQERQDDLAEEVVAVVLESPGLATGEIEAALDVRGVSRRRGDASKALRLARNRGEIRLERRGTSKHYFPPYPPLDSPRLSPAEETQQ